MAEKKAAVTSADIQEERTPSGIETGVDSPLDLVFPDPDRQLMQPVRVSVDPSTYRLEECIIRREIILAEIDRLERLAAEIYEDSEVMAEYIWQWIERYARMLEGD